MTSDRTRTTCGRRSCWVRVLARRDRGRHVALARRATVDDGTVVLADGLVRLPLARVDDTVSHRFRSYTAPPAARLRRRVDDGQGCSELAPTACDERPSSVVGALVGTDRGGRPQPTAWVPAIGPGPPTVAADVLKLVLPKGSLEKATLELFEAADLTVRRSSSVDYKATIDDPRIDEVRILRPQEIPRYVAEGLFDLGITGRDWVEETEQRGRVARRAASTRRRPSNPVRIVVAVPGDSPCDRVDDLPDGVRVSTEYPELTRRFFASEGHRGRHPPVLRRHRGQGPRHRRLHRRHHRDRPGAARRRPQDHRRDPAVLHRAGRQPGGLRGPGKRHAMHQISTLLEGVLEARGKVLVKLNVGQATTSTRSSSCCRR